MTARDEEEGTNILALELSLKQPPFLMKRRKLIDPVLVDAGNSDGVWDLLLFRKLPSSPLAFILPPSRGSNIPLRPMTYLPCDCESSLWIRVWRVGGEERTC